MTLHSEKVSPFVCTCSCNATVLCHRRKTYIAIIRFVPDLYDMSISMYITIREIVRQIVYQKGLEFT
jgi:hypothetical protein